MKWTLLFCLLLLPASLHAQDSPAVKPLRQTPSNVEIINGKKFFSLQNARRFRGSTNDPKALSVLHHPRDPGTIPAHRSFPLPGPRATGPAAGAQPATPSDQVLSIFTPEDKRVTAVPPTK